MLFRNVLGFQNTQNDTYRLIRKYCAEFETFSLI